MPHAMYHRYTTTWWVAGRGGVSGQPWHKPDRGPLGLVHTMAWLCQLQHVVCLAQLGPCSCAGGRAMGVGGWGGPSSPGQRLNPRSSNVGIIVAAVDACAGWDVAEAGGEQLVLSSGLQVAARCRRVYASMGLHS
jgi:hypothetical protein